MARMNAKTTGTVMSSKLRPLAGDVAAQLPTDAGLNVAGASVAQALKLVADQLADPAWIAEASGHVRWFNTRWFEYTGQPPGRDWRLALRNEDRERADQLLRQAVAAGKSWEDGFPLRRHDGEWRWFTSRGLPMRTLDGASTFWLGTYTDITEQRLAAQELADARLRLELALDAAKMGVWDWNLRTDRVRWSGKIYSSLGMPESHDRTGNSFIDGIHPQDRERVIPEIKRALGRGQDFDVEFRYLTEDGQIRWVVSRGRSRLGADGKPEQAVGVNFDITERKRTEQQLLDADARRNEFLAMLGHELRNPISPIMTSMALLPRLGELLPRQQSLVEVVQRQTHHLKRLVDDLLEVSRVTQGRIEIHKTQVRLADLMRDAVETVYPELERRHHKIVSQIDDDLHVDADRARMTQVFVNILNNAIKFTPNGGTIDIKASIDASGSVTVRITDTGVGISADLLANVFDLFTQGERTLNRSEGGLGIGLALVRRLVELQGGDVSVTSPGEGAGTTVTVRMPPHTTQAGESEHDVHVPPSERETLSLVVVDDNEDAGRTLSMLLESDGHHVRLAFDTAEALALIRHDRPSAVLLDIGMPGMDGFELARQIHQDPLLADVGLVAITGYGRPIDRERGKSAGFGAYLLKPASASDIYDAVARALEARRC
jgi:PAS domain S-box-containing protein